MVLPIKNVMSVFYIFSENTLKVAAFQLMT